MPTQILSKEATDIVILASESIDTFKSASGFYPTIENVAAEVQGTLPLNESVTDQDIKDASAILTLKYPNILNTGQYEIYNTFYSELSTALASRLIDTDKNNRTLAVIFIIAFIAYLFITNRG